VSTVHVPIYFEPRPAQREAWARRLSGEYDYYFKIWHRQYGKDTDDIQFALYSAYQNPGTQSAYVGIDNKWIGRNIWNKYLDGRKHWSNYPPGVIDIHETKQLVRMLNNGEDGKAEALIQFIGFKESESLIGSSYDSFFFSEVSLYRRNALDFIVPIWDNKIAEGNSLLVNMNFTPRGLSNIAADFLRTYTGEDEWENWGGAHGRVFVDILRADESLKEDGTRLYPDEVLEVIRQRYIRQHGNDNLFRQEYLCEFMAVNAGLVYPAIEILRKEGRYTPFNLDPRYPVYVAWDISSKGKESDWTVGIVFQYYEGRLWIYDYYEDNRVAVVEAVDALKKQGHDYFHRIHTAIMPWDADRSGSISSPLEECAKAFPSVAWRKLERTFEADGINRVRKLFPNMMINSNKCAWIVECLESWEYKMLSSVDDWAAKPKHDRYSHVGDALRYIAEGVEQFEFIRSLTGRPQRMPSHYGEWQEGDSDDAEWDELPPGMRPSKFSPLRKKKPADLFEMTEDGWRSRAQGS
jgi:hypothetical protein